ncbi:hypothetical protein GCM10027277_46840 [Pseudoduganella ginsengisoli]|uniref:Lipoprotein n=1 Tax=Pseudoduganella ginsengisoli TaxID=1462440 RepID=A0A6L6Q3V3_9BURK|nr:hypothetical protein [Pseudoduganella ginsengisoli]MTW04129.1 hypothetical protein [Pseudoduganella ginsengisoli]
MKLQLIPSALAVALALSTTACAQPVKASDAPPAVPAAQAATPAVPAAPAPAAAPAAPAAPAAAAAPAPEEPAAPPPASVVFLDSSLFDNALSSQLASGKDQVEVAITGKISLNAIPGRMDKWITAVASKGEVALTQQAEAPLKPKFVLGLLPTIFSFIKMARTENLVDPATKYNASIQYHLDRSGEAVIDKILFVKKPPKQ